KTLQDTGGIDYAYVVGNDECRFRVILFYQRGKLSLVARRVNTSIPTFEKLGLPASIEKLCHFDQGMIILAGVTGSGKSATIAASTIGRILDLFPADMHPAIRQALAFNLKAVVAQKLLPSIKPGIQRVPTNEIMIVNPTIRELIIKQEDKKLVDAIRIGFQ